MIVSIIILMAVVYILIVIFSEYSEYLEVIPILVLGVTLIPITVFILILICIFRKIHSNISYHHSLTRVMWQLDDLHASDHIYIICSHPSLIRWRGLFQP